MKPRIGVYVCHCGTNISSKVDTALVAQLAAGLPDVVVARDYKYMCSDPGQDLIKSDIGEFGLNRVVVASCSPRMHEPTFRRALADGGLNPYLLEMANIRELVSWVTADPKQATRKAMSMVRGAVERVRLHEPLEDTYVPACQDTLVVGAGIAGMTTALKLANAGVKVTLVERQPSIGGQMARFDKTFPTMDCAACILTPKMVEVSQHPNIELLTLAEVTRVDGFVGNFDVTIKVKPRGVDMKDCTGCGTCWEKCPKKATSEFDMGLGVRKAIYLPFPQAVPNKPVIDRENCTYYKTGKCKACEIFCPAKAIRFEQEEQTLRRHVGAVVLATGIDIPEISQEHPEYGHRRLTGVVTGLEFERMSNASGPTQGHIVGRNGKEPKRVAVLHCIGSREENRKYCSRICCMSSLKTAYLVKDHTDAEVYNFYIDMRAFGKGYEEFYERLRSEGVHFIRGKVAEVEEDGERLIVKAEDTLRGVQVNLPVDLVVLSTALTPQKDAGETAIRFGVGRSADGFFMEEHPKLEPLKTATEGVYLAGTCQGPRDIPDTVAQAAGAAMEVLEKLSSGKVKVKGAVAAVDAENCSGCKVCISMCPYTAIGFDAAAGVARVNAALCKGCGTCSAACPSGAMHVRHFETDQILRQIEGVCRV
ncbi:MAG TPA: CoB--CoM heterodisulfide reductase iron-sulfur subunit A family protein [Symbiobacteriaceae bacterium]|nr:CoB--CoM heterodisulfide reductase iron-sulfur subunit A family protein [Symbiobacteriaceae bacterium]